eukprot:5853730-Lingulodinium_polyedra.AAC.1
MTISVPSRGRLKHQVSSWRRRRLSTSQVLGCADQARWVRACHDSCAQVSAFPDDCIVADAREYMIIPTQFMARQVGAASTRQDCYPIRPGGQHALFRQGRGPKKSSSFRVVFLSPLRRHHAAW